MAGRKLVSIRRRVPASDAAEYEQVWTRLAEAVRASGAHAWRFRSEQNEGEFIEFLEFKADADPRVSDEVVGALEELEGSSEGVVEGWIDAEEPTGGEKG